MGDRDKPGEGIAAAEAARVLPSDPEIDPESVGYVGGGSVNGGISGENILSALAEGFRLSEIPARTSKHPAPVPTEL